MRGGEISKDHLGYIRAQASNIQKASRIPAEVATFDDLVGYGTIGYLEALKSYDGRDNVVFFTFAHYRIRGAIFDGLRLIGWVPRALYAKEAVHVVVSDPHGPLMLQYLDAKGNAEDRRLEELEFNKMTRTMHRAIRRLPRQEREIIRRYYFGDASLNEVGNGLGLSKSWTSRLHARAMKKLREVYLTVQAESRQADNRPLGKNSTVFAKATEGLLALLKRLEK